MRPRSNRRVLQCAIGCPVAGVTPVMPDLGDPSTVCAGCLHRYGRECPQPDGEELRKLSRFVDKWLETNLEPIEAGHDFDPYAWIDSTPYPLSRKDELRKVVQESEGLGLSTKERACKSFGKTETYMDYKFARGINSRSDVFKCLSGPYFSAIEKRLFANPSFIKHVPFRDRAQYITERLSGHGQYYATDYTSYEASFSPVVMAALEFRLYRHALRNYPKVANLLCKVLGGKSVCVYNGFRIEVDGVRMSGDMCTSLGNGFSNLMLFLYALSEDGLSGEGVVEGDDGLFWTSGPLDESRFARLGFNLKVIQHTDFLRASFCGLVVTSVGTSMADPRKVIANLGWSHSPLAYGKEKTKLGLLKSKALSLIYEHPRCPILTPLALRILYLTATVDAINETGYKQDIINVERVKFKDATQREIDAGINTAIRLDFEAVYGVPVAEQLILEDYFSTFELGFIDHPVIQAWYRPDSALRSYDSRYVSHLPTKFDSCFDVC